MDPKAQAAFDKKEERYTLLNGGISDIKTLIKFGAGKDAVDTALTQVNEVFEEYQASYLDFLSLIDSEAEKEKNGSHYADMEKKLDSIRTEAGRYIFKLEQHNKAPSNDKNKKNENPTTDKPNQDPQQKCGHEQVVKDKEMDKNEQDHESVSQAGSKKSSGSKASAKKIAIRTNCIAQANED